MTSASDRIEAGDVAVDAALGPNRAWLLVSGLAAAQLVSWGIYYYAFSLFIVPMEAELGWSRVSISGALSVGLLTSGIAAYGVGAWIDRRGGRLLMTAGSAFGSVLLVAWSAVDSLPAFYAIWLGLGVAMAATLYEPVFAVLTRLFARTYRTKITALTLVGGFASTVFVPLVQILITELGWRDALLVLAAINAVVCLPVHLGLLRDGPQALPPSDGPALDGLVHRALRTPVFWGLALCFTAMYAIVTAVGFHLVPMLLERGHPPGIVVAAVTVIGPAQVAGRVAILAFGRRSPMTRIGRAILPLYPVSMVILVLAPGSVAALFAAAALYGVANGIMTIVRGTAVADLMWREGYGAINGALALPTTVAKAGAPLAAAAIWAASGGYDAVLWSIAALGILATAGYWFAVRAARR